MHERDAFAVELESGDVCVPNRPSGSENDHAQVRERRRPNAFVEVRLRQLP